eukprot:TRINITY_DN12933_c0_g1_i1.p1 TRINITY_DN12933_c0_g1~~TRINITY_DN12933_c0_g1_i1.p1  ORF type:complete len:284 (+),score=-4.64 TRINITY_DN12933_c0_g1_i1:64-915(+)
MCIRDRVSTQSTWVNCQLVWLDCTHAKGLFHLSKPLIGATIAYKLQYVGERMGEERLVSASFAYVSDDNMLVWESYDLVNKSFEFSADGKFAHSGKIVNEVALPEQLPQDKVILRIFRSGLCLANSEKPWLLWCCPLTLKGFKLLDLSTFLDAPHETSLGYECSFGDMSYYTLLVKKNDGVCIVHAILHDPSDDVVAPGKVLVSRASIDCLEFEPTLVYVKSDFSDLFFIVQIGDGKLVRIDSQGCRPVNLVVPPIPCDNCFHIVCKVNKAASICLYRLRLVN